jgi:hypothetical protein
MIRSQLGQSIRGTQSRSGSFVTLVAGTAAGPVRGLLQGVHRQHTESYGKRMTHGDFIEAACRLTSDILEVGSLASDYGSEGNEARVAAGLCRRRGRGRQLEGTREPDHVDVIAWESGFGATSQRTIEKFPRDQLVVAANQNRDPPRGAQAAGEVGHESVSEEVAELVALDLQIRAIVLIWIGEKRNTLHDFQSIPFQANQLTRIVGHDSDRGKPKIEQNLRSDTVVPEIGSKPESFVGLNRVGAGVLKSVCPELVQ